MLVVVLGLVHNDRFTARAEVTRLTAANDSLLKVQRPIDSVFVVRVDTFRTRRVVFDTLVQSVPEWKHDTIRVVEFVTQAESTVAACSAALLSCAEKVRIRDQRIATLDSLGKGWAKVAAAERKRGWRNTLTAAGVGLLGGLLLKR